MIFYAGNNIDILSAITYMSVTDLLAPYSVSVQVDSSEAECVVEQVWASEAEGVVERVDASEAEGVVERVWACEAEGVVERVDASDAEGVVEWVGIYPAITKSKKVIRLKWYNYMRQIPSSHCLNCFLYLLLHFFLFTYIAPYLSKENIK